jgi:hypothetical protein
MGLFGAIKAAGDRISATLNEWMGGDFVKVAAVTGALLFIEEFSSNLVVNLLKWTGGKAVALKTAGRVALSGLYYYAIKDKTVALAASVAPMALTFSELFAYLIGYAPTEASKAVASMIRRALGAEKAGAGAAAPLASVSTVAVVPTMPVAPAPPTPAPAEQAPAPAPATREPILSVT